MSKLVLAMACKNEAVTIGHAIRSIAGICDRAVISIDSTDNQNTRDAAQLACIDCNLPVTFVEHIWENSFSKMRNGVLETIEATGGGDWLIWIDGHEYLCPGHQHILKSLVETCDPTIWLWSFLLKMMDHDGQWRDSFMQAKMWRIGQGIKYTSREMHNQVDLDTVPLEHRAGHADIWIMHERTVENANARKAQRDELMPALLTPKIAEGDEDALFHMLAHWYSCREFEKFFELYKTVKWTDTALMPDCQYQLRVYGAIMRQLQLDKAIKDIVPEKMLPIKISEIIEFMERSFSELAIAEMLSSGRNDHIMQRARNFFFMGDATGNPEFYDLAYRQFELASHFEIPITQSFAQHAEYTWVPVASMANCLEKKGELATAWKLYMHALGQGGMVAENILLIERALRELTPAPIGDVPGRPILLVLDKLGQFSGAIARELSKTYTVITSREPDPAAIAHADIIWCEWVDENLITISQVKRKDKVIFARLHGYETIERDYPAHVRWENVSALIGVSRQMLNYMGERFGEIPTRQVVIHNGLDINKFHYREREAGRNVAFVSLLNNKKNIGQLIQIAREFSEYTFHISGTWQDNRLREYFEHSKARHDCNNLLYAGHHSDVDGFLEDKDFLLNTSLWESFSFAIHEAMTKGIKPLVHDWVSVDEFIPEDLRWRTMADLRRLFEGPYESARYRAIAEQYDVAKIAGRFVEMIESMRVKEEIKEAVTA